MANSVDPNRTPLSVVSDLGLHCLARPLCPTMVNMAMSGKKIFFNNHEMRNKTILHINTGSAGTLVPRL